MRAVALLGAEPEASDDAIVAALGRHLCRCGAHVRILRAVRAARDTLREQRKPR
jgi:nicotinate dehydrogenase subunit A